MRSFIITLSACGLAVSTLAACGGSSCEDAVGNAARVFGWGGDGYAGMRAKAVARCKEDKWPEKMRTCLVAAKTRSEVDRCQKYEHESREPTSSVEAYDDYVKKSKKSEAELNLNMIQKSLKVHYIEMAAFPTGTAPLTPAAPCCEGPNHTCAPNPRDWEGNPVWEALDFAVSDPGYFQYSYASTDGQTAIVEAVGDLDCDATTVTFTLRCDAPQGNPSCTLDKPARLD